MLAPSLPVSAPQPLPTLPTSGHCLALSLRVPDCAGCLTTCLKQPSWRFQTTASAACTAPSACRQVAACIIAVCVSNMCWRVSACLHCAVCLQASAGLQMLLCISLPALRHAPAGKCLSAMLSRSSSASHVPQRGARALPPAQCALLQARGSLSSASTVLLSHPVHIKATSVVPQENAPGKCFALL